MTPDLEAYVASGVPNWFWRRSPIDRHHPARCSLPDNTLGASRCFTPEEMNEAGVTFADLVAGATRVVCRAGYGILSQLIALGREGVVLGRRRFPEEAYLLEGRNHLKDSSGEHLRDLFLQSFMKAAGLFSEALLDCLHDVVLQHAIFHPFQGA